MVSLGDTAVVSTHQSTTQSPPWEVPSHWEGVVFCDGHILNPPWKIPILGGRVVFVGHFQSFLILHEKFQLEREGFYKIKPCITNSLSHYVCGDNDFERNSFATYFCFFQLVMQDTRWVSREVGFRRIVHPAGREGSPRRELGHALIVELTKTQQVGKPHQSAVRYFLLIFLKKIGGHQSFLCGHWYHCFRLFVKNPRLSLTCLLPCLHTVAF